MVSGLVLALAFSSCVFPAVAESLTAYRAVYDLSLGPEANKAGYASLSGRLVYELNGSDCEGYVLTQRVLTRIEMLEGQVVYEDTQSASFEDVLEGSFQFITRSMLNNKINLEARGIALHGEKGTTLSRSEPSQLDKTLPKEVLFPSAFLKRVVREAKAGERFLTATIFDGYDQGDQALRASISIGRGSAFKQADEVLAPLAGVRFWPLRIAYFPASDASETMVPLFSLSVDLFDNGVSGNLQIDYADFMIVGKMVELKLLSMQACPQ